MRYFDAKIDDILDKSSEINPRTEREIIEKAYSFAKKKYGEEDKNELLRHCLNVAFTCARLGVDGQTIASALLCRLEQKELSREEGEIKKAKQISLQVAKIRNIEEKNREKVNSETLGKIIMSAATDIRALFVVLSDKLQELREKQDEKSEETKKEAKIMREVYAPIAHKLGLFEIKWEIEDLCFKVLERREYDAIKQKIGESRESREEKLKKTKQEILKRIKEEGINAKIFTRAKSFYGISQKMKKKKMNFWELQDLLGIRIICESIKDAYTILGLIHSLYEPIPGTFDDFIANPKPNNYRSIHTTFRNKAGEIIEAQIRTWEMNTEAEGGAPAHWLYKEYKKDRDFDKRLGLIRQLVEWGKNTKNWEQILNELKIDFAQNKILVLSEKGEIVELPQKATPIDFAYALSEEIGNKCTAALVNGKSFPLHAALNSGDTVEIITSEKAKPKKYWLGLGITDKARAKIGTVLQLKKEKTSEKKEGLLSWKMLPWSREAKIRKKIKISQCCNPKHGDVIVGLQTTKRKISLHRADCKNILAEKDRRKIVAMDWASIGEKELCANLRVKAVHKVDILTELLKVMAKNNAIITSTNASVEKEHTVCSFGLEVKSLGQMEKIISELKKIEEVREVEKF